jgi:ribosomal protein S18 acetylase RimI-like enzyme
MRPGRAEDLPRLIELWRREVVEGRQDSAPQEARLRRMLARFDWEAKSRVVDDGDRLSGAVLVTSRPSPEGVFATVYAAGPAGPYHDLMRWGVQLARAAGAEIVQTYMTKDRGDGLAALGLKPVRPWWRMDRSLTDGLPAPVPVPGYEVIDGAAVAPGRWMELFNSTFADHWRFVPRSEDEVIAGKPPELCLMAVTDGRRSPAAMTLGEVVENTGDLRPQPVGLVSSVGTLPEHRRQGLAGWMVADLLHRMRMAGARYASLYVDGLSAMRAYDVYRKLGFEVTFEAEVWEATYP